MIDDDDKGINATTMPTLTPRAAGLLCDATLDGRHCVLPAFHADSMNATPHEFEPAEALPFPDVTANSLDWKLT